MSEDRSAATLGTSSRRFGDGRAAVQRPASWHRRSVDRYDWWLGPISAPSGRVPSPNASSATRAGEEHPTPARTPRAGHGAWPCPPPRSLLRHNIWRWTCRKHPSPVRYPRRTALSQSTLSPRKAASTLRASKLPKRLVAKVLRTIWTAWRDRVSANWWVQGPVRRFRRTDAETCARHSHPFAKNGKASDGLRWRPSAWEADGMVF